MRALSALLLAAVVLPSTALAQVEGDGSGGWREVFDAHRRLGRLYEREGLARLIQAMGPDQPELGDAPDWLLLDQALMRFERARRYLPEDAELAYYTACALARYERPAADGSTEDRMDEAMDAWHRVRRLDSHLFPDRVASELAVIYMRRHEFSQARAEYEAALRNAVPPTVDLFNRFFLPASTETQLAILYSSVDPANVHGNLAEAAMLSGDIPGAIAHYQAALDQAQEPLTRSLAQWGMSVALDRNGAHEDAIRQAQRAMRDDPIQGHPDFGELLRAHGAFAILYLPGVFFEPRYEVHAYEAIGHEAMARRDSGGEDPEALRRALRSWRLFLAEGGAGSPFAAIANEHAQRLARRVESASTAGPQHWAPSLATGPGYEPSSDRQGALVARRRAGQIYLDGRLLGTAPFVERRIPIGEHTVRVVRAGRERTFTIDVAAGSVHTIDPSGQLVEPQPSD